MPTDSLSGVPLDELIDRALRLSLVVERDIQRRGHPAGAAHLFDGDDDDSDEYWAVIRELQSRGNQETFEKARSLALEAEEPARILGVRILGQLGWIGGAGHRPFMEESLPLVEALAAPGQSVRMVEEALIALMHLCDERSAPTVLAHVTHPDPDVRLAVARALPRVAGESPPRAVVEALFELMDDPVADVRDWATLGLASQLDIDTPEVRDALVARVDDTGNEWDVSGEAVRGLAKRKDERALAPILRALAWRDPDPGPLALEAAEELADARCLPALYALREYWDEYEWEGQEWDEAALAAAIEACERGNTTTELGESPR